MHKGSWELGFSQYWPYPNYTMKWLTLLNIAVTAHSEHINTVKRTCLNVSFSLVCDRKVLRSRQKPNDSLYRGCGWHWQQTGIRCLYKGMTISLFGPNQQNRYFLFFFSLSSFPLSHNQVTQSRSTLTETTRQVNLHEAQQNDLHHLLLNIYTPT